ncbi:hypothetical protein [Macrococcus epidermidis]|uniref:hypothetical protein n=1 Tax=Macrococcus epidermidis TaxID=1902580 RepID=UPI0020B8BAE2|nr:hypothetical protein [Macrococcus epidermidis]UTH16278.1 hypothetical protein KFV12_00400 [Macrococcus epidermidis]
MTDWFLTGINPQMFILKREGEYYHVISCENDIKENEFLVVMRSLKTKNIKDTNYKLELEYTFKYDKLAFIWVIIEDFEGNYLYFKKHQIVDTFGKYKDVLEIYKNADVINFGFMVYGYNELIFK